MERLQVISDGPAIVWAFNGTRVIGFGWRPALDICKVMRAQIDAAEAPEPPVVAEHTVTFAQGQIRLGIRVQGEMLMFIANGRLLFDIPVAQAKQLWQATLGQARKLEEADPSTADRVARDAAIALRSGAPFGMSDNPAIRDEAHKLAAWDTQLRQMPMAPGVQSQEALGAPVVTLGSLDPAVELRRLAARLTPEERRLIVNVEERNV